MKKKMGMRLISAVLAAAMTALLFTGCGALDKKEIRVDVVQLKMVVSKEPDT